MGSEKSEPPSPSLRGEGGSPDASAVTNASLVRALAEERLINARRINLIRFSGITFFFALFVLLGWVLGLRTWQGNLGYFAPYWIVTALLFLAARRWDAAARFASWAVALVDMPMVFLLQWATFPTTPNVAAVAGYTLGVYVLLLVIEALSLERLRIWYTALIGASFEGLLQHLAGVDSGAIFSTFIIMGIAAATCAYGCRRITDLISRIVKDVTERRRAEDALRARDDFLSVASHELRTPLTNVQLNVEGLRRQLKRRDGAATPEILARIDSAYASTQRLARLIDALLDVSRLKTGRFDLELETADLASIAAAVVEQSTEALSEANCPVTLHAPAPVTGHWDRLRLEQVVTNLLSNAMKYGAGKPIEISVVDRQDWGEISVRDHGIGIAPAHQARVFDQFERAVSKRDFSGLGLGLWICGQNVSLHGGSISLDSAAGRGAAFTVTLPRKRLSAS
jgi:signal transduction histidine kinase